MQARWNIISLTSCSHLDQLEAIDKVTDQAIVSSLDKYTRFVKDLESRLAAAKDGGLSGMSNY